MCNIWCYLCIGGLLLIALIAAGVCISAGRCPVSWADFKDKYDV